MNALDITDWRILYQLHNEGRLSNQDLAQRVELSPSACLRRVKALEQAGFIERYRAELNLKKLGYTFEAMVHVTIDQKQGQSHERFMEAIDAIPEVTYAYMVTGACNYILKICARDLTAFSELVIDRSNRIPEVRELCSYIVLKEVKQAPTQIFTANVEALGQDPV